RNLTLRILPVLAMLTASAVPPVRAQSDVTLRASVPFEFVVGKTTLPAGQYVVKEIQPRALLIQSLDGRGRAIVLTDAAQAGKTQQQQSKLIFNHYGSEYFLWQIWTTGADIGRELPPTRGEREAARMAGHRETAAVFAQ
ncbi:MAG TPA: hypothetical protein VEU62_06580, partial [Bryobacterales bacterium]|nr:hypothetical protein [Bryobacterales bacterium]